MATIEVIAENPLNDEWYEKKGLNRIECNMFLLDLEFEESDAVAIGKIEKQFNVSREDARDMFVQAIQDQLKALEFNEQITAE